MRMLNPNHPVTQLVDVHAHKLTAMLMHKLGLTQVFLTIEDIESFPPGHAIVCWAHQDSMELRLVTEAEGRALAAKAGGLPT